MAMMLKEQAVYGERITEARELRGFSQITLAGLVDVQRQAISAFEKNKTRPAPETLFRIASTTKFPVQFFLNDRPRGDSVRTAPLSFRKLGSSTKGAILQAKQYENLLADIYYYLKHYLDFSKPQVPFFSEIDYRTLTDSAIEGLAEKVRREWGLSDGPITNLTLLLENKGILIAPVQLSTTMDAFSTWRHERPIMMLGDSLKSCARRRFNEAHELGHLVLHSMVEQADFDDPESRKRMDVQAHRFAGAFLFPAKSVANEYFSNSIAALTKLKERWKISIQAIAKRLCDLGYINENQYKYVYIQLDRKREPLDDKIPMEQPTVIKRAFDVLLENKLLSIRQAIDDLAIPEIDFSMLTDIHLEKMTNHEETIIPFKLRVVK